MKKYIISLSVLSSVVAMGQHKHTARCGFHHKQTQLEQKFPEIKEARERLDKQILERKINGKRDAKYSNISAMNYTGQVYEIPVVVHVIESNAAKNARLKLTDEQIKTWIENANKMYAGTYGGDYYPTGDGLDQSAVIPFKLVLAKRDQNCNSTTGIIRYDGSTLSGYDDNGVYDEEAGVTEEEIVRFAPHWSESGYYNIYIVTAFDGDSSNSGLMGYAYKPHSSDSYYHTFMKSSVVTLEDDSTLAHEFGHSLGLDHPFGDADSNGGKCPTVSSGLTDSEACLVDNDKVCDTEPIQSLLSVFPTPSNLRINPCTNENYKDTQYNIMNYTYSTRKFTAGQRERALELFMANRKNLTHSLAGKDSGGETIVVANASCLVVNTNTPGRYSIGPRVVKLGSIDNMSSVHSSEDGHYTDFTTQTCLFDNLKTDLKEEDTHTISINLSNRNEQRVKVWIDFNNDGIFTTDEIIADSNSFIKTEIFTKTFTIPSTAVKNTYLRMRVGADYSNFSPCSIRYGQIEDYAVRIIPKTLAVVEQKDTNTIVVYNKDKNALVLSNADKFGEYQIYDMSGRLIQSGNASTNEIELKGISLGTYVLKYQSKTTKFIKN